jgi:serine/threonine-protein kinase
MGLPEKISKYDIVRELGRGSMGIVYEGFDPDIQRKVAIKTLMPNISDQDLVAEYHTRFKIEAQASARCMHPNIVTILEYGDLNGMPFMVMEFIPGQPLDEILNLNAPIKFNRALKMFSQMLKGLYFAHQSGVIHRDIKPSKTSEVTQRGYTVGTPHYMAPEQEASSNVDCRADLFSLTIILMQMLAKVPTTSSLAHDTLSPKGIYITPRVDMNQSIPLQFLPVIQKGLAFKPEDRYETAQEFAIAVKLAVADLKRATSNESPIEAGIESSKELEQEKLHHLQEMERMLVHYVGPIGASLIEVYSEETTNLHQLAEKVASEIPNDVDRERFLQAWQAEEEVEQAPHVDTGRVETVIKSVDATVMAGAKAPESGVSLRGKELHEVENLYAQYVGPMAEFMIQEVLDDAADFEELVERLTDSIPSADEKTDFKLKIKKLAIS